MLRGEAIRLVFQPELSHEQHYTQDLTATSTHDRGHAPAQARYIRDSKVDSDQGLPARLGYTSIH
jgi:hypothetical protein